MKTIRLHDRDFRLLLGAEEIEQAIDRVARQMNKDLAGESPLFIGVLNGAFMFVSDLLKKITVEGTEISFVKIASYDGLASSGNVQNLIGLKEDIAGRTVVVLEDMVDSGESMVYLKRMLEERNPKQVKIAAMFYKPGALRYDLTLDYTCIPLGNDFVVGRGLDYDGVGRNLPDWYTIES